MLFRIEPAPYFRGQKPAPVHKFIEVLAVIPAAVEPDRTFRNLLLCRTDTGLHRIDERLIWAAIEGGQYREARRVAVKK